MEKELSIKVVTETYVPIWSLADRLKKTRAGTKLSIANFSKFTSLTPRQIQYAESGKASPHDVVVTIYAAKTGVNYQWLSTGVVPRHHSEQISELESLLGLDSNQEPIGSSSLPGLDSNQEPFGYCLLPNFRPKIEKFSSYLSFQGRQLNRFGGGHAFINRFA
jgi:transcriptional regulator with XRE-family HTH domain